MYLHKITCVTKHTLWPHNRRLAAMGTTFARAQGPEILPPDQKRCAQRDAAVSDDRRDVEDTRSDR